MNRHYRPSPSGLSGIPDLGLSAPGIAAHAVFPPSRAVVVDPAKEVRLPRLVGDGRTSVRQAVKQSVVLVVTDDSGSTFGPFGTDPTDVRDAAARSLLRLLRESGGGRAGVIRWGSDVGDVLPVCEVVKNKQALARALSAPTCLGGTNMFPALERAAQELPALRPADQAVVFVITDGICDPDAAVTAAMASLPPGSVHLLLVDRSDQCTAEIEASWRTTPAATVTRLTTVDTRAMATELATVFATALGLRLATTDQTARRSG